MLKRFLEDLVSKLFTKYLINKSRETKICSILIFNEIYYTVLYVKSVSLLIDCHQKC